MLIPVGLTFNAHPERTVSVESLENMQPEYSHGGRTELILRSCPEMAEFSAGDTAGGPGRGIIVCAGTLYVVLNKALFKVLSDGTAVELTRIDGTGPVGMSENGEKIHICISGGKEYLFDVFAETVTVLTKTAYGLTSAYGNGRFYTEDPDATDQGRFYYSDIDGTTWVDYDFATAEQKTDDAIAMFWHRGVLHIFGTSSTEFWGSDADGPVPVVGAYLNVGIAGRRAVAAADELVGFLASDGSFRLIQGYNSQRVSTPAVEAALAADADAEVLAYTEQGHTVFQVSTPDLTLCYDAVESQKVGKPVWFKRSTAGDRHAARGCVSCYGKLLTVSVNDGKVYELSRSVYPDVREFTLPTFANDAQRQWSTLDEIELIQRVGTGAIPDGESQVMLQVSRNNGMTWGEERWANEGTVGQYDTRVRWLRFGRFRQITARFRKTDQTEWTVLGVSARGSQ